MGYYKDSEGVWLDYRQGKSYIGIKSEITMRFYRRKFNWVWKKVPTSAVAGRSGSVVVISIKSLDEYLHKMGKKAQYNAQEGASMLKKYKIHFNPIVCTREAKTIEDFIGKEITIPVKEDLVDAIEDIQTGVFYRFSKKETKK